MQRSPTNQQLYLLLSSLDLIFIYRFLPYALLSLFIFFTIYHLFFIWFDFDLFLIGFYLSSGKDNKNNGCLFILKRCRESEQLSEINVFFLRPFFNFYLPSLPLVFSVWFLLSFADFCVELYFIFNFQRLSVVGRCRLLP